MPTYDYQCTSCEEEFEFFHSITREPLTKCPSCEKDTLKRLIGMGAGIIFKGSGFYQTDYKNASRNDSKSSEKEGNKKDSSPSESKNAAPGSSESSGKKGQKSSAEAGVGKT